MAKSWVILLALFNGILLSTAEVFSALSHTERVLGIELELIDALDEYIKQQEQRLKVLKNFSRDVQGAAKQARKEGSKFLSHPVNSYLMIKRFVNEWPLIEKTVSKETSAEAMLLEKLNQWKSSFPDNTDLKGAISAIKRLEEVYSLEPADFSEGRFGSHHGTRFMLAPRDAYTVGRYSYIEGDFEGTRKWMLETLRLMDLGVKNDTAYPNKEEVLDHLAFSEYKVEDVESAMVHTLEWLKINPENERARNNVIQYGKVYENNKEYYEKVKSGRKKTKRRNNQHGWMRRKIPQKFLKDVNWHIERDVYKRLCRGEKLPKTPQDKKRLHCWYFTADPLCTIKRCAMERVFTNPDIVIFKKIMSDSEIEEVRKISEPLLNRATVHNPLTGHLETASYRISKNCWLTAEDGDVIQRVEKRIAAMTRLDLESAEGFQVQNYGLAGHYDPHFDFSRNLSNSSLGALGTGNRLATVLLYMTQVEAGGATVFPYVGARVRPEKGDAVFWHNLLRSGEGDFRTRHAGCPVLSGIKWVANKWIHEHGNELKRPCLLRPDE